ncbi:MAG: hypothetical protein AAGA54_36130 [Myxococcota bacterium]
MTTLRSATEVVAKWQDAGSTPEAALALAQTQAAGLGELLGDAQGWDRLVSIAQRTVDPWFVTDWPDTFDPLVLVLPLCKTVDWACATCPIGQQQDDRACAHPEVPVGRLGAAISAGKHHQAQTEFSVLRLMLRHAATAP